MKNLFNQKNIFGVYNKIDSIFKSGRTVCIKHRDGRITEHKNITEPWRYIKAVLKEMDVENAWVKEEK